MSGISPDLDQAGASLEVDPDKDGRGRLVEWAAASAPAEQMAHQPRTLSDVHLCISQLKIKSITIVLKTV